VKVLVERWGRKRNRQAWKKTHNIEKREEEKRGGNPYNISKMKSQRTRKTLREQKRRKEIPQCRPVLTFP